MKRRTWLGVTTLALVFALGTSAYALEKTGNFEQMLPLMKQMHPEFSNQQLEDMYQSCHTNDNTQMMNNSMKNMMNPA